MNTITLFADCLNEGPFDDQPKREVIVEDSYAAVADYGRAMWSDHFYVFGTQKENFFINELTIEN